jgi:MoxR-like ATPase
MTDPTDARATPPGQPDHAYEEIPVTTTEPTPLDPSAQPLLSPPQAAASPAQARAESAALLEDALFQVKRVVVGQDRLVERVMVCLLANGHVLIEGFPGLAKTLTVSTMARVIGGSMTRIQFTPDLVPADLVGTRIWRPSTEDFDTEWGPVFANLVLADEINRAPAKVQSALLEAMAERQVSIGGHTRELPSPFVVLATQNPIESEGVYALPEAQRDRFLMHVVVPHPTYEEETAIATRMSGDAPRGEQVLTTAQLLELQALVQEVFVHHAVQDYAVRLVMSTRDPARWGFENLQPHIALGASPRGTLGLLSAARAIAVLRGRRFVVPQDVFDIAPEVLRHRITLTYDALAEGVTTDDVLREILSRVQAPRIAPQTDGGVRVDTLVQAQSPYPAAG